MQLTLLALDPHNPVTRDRFRRRIPLKLSTLCQKGFGMPYVIFSVEPKFDQRRRYTQPTGQGPVGTGFAERAYSQCPP